MRYLKPLVIAAALGIAPAAALASMPTDQALMFARAAGLEDDLRLIVLQSAAQTPVMQDVTSRCKPEVGKQIILTSLEGVISTTGETWLAANARLIDQVVAPEVIAASAKFGQSELRNALRSADSTKLDAAYTTELKPVVIEATAQFLKSVVEAASDCEVQQ